MYGKFGGFPAKNSALFGLVSPFVSKGWQIFKDSSLRPRPFYLPDPEVPQGNRLFSVVGRFPLKVNPKHGSMHGIFTYMKTIQMNQM